MKLKAICLFLITILFMFSCNQANKARVSVDTPVGPMVPQAIKSINDVESAEETSNDGVAEVDKSIQRMLIKTGDIQFETDDIDATRNQILSEAKKYNGYISSDKEYKSYNRISNTIEIRVPSKDFDALLNESTKGVDRFDRKSIDVQDVTEEYLDIEARVKTKKELENRYMNLLNRANSVKDILEIERELGELRSDIESIEGRMKYLQSQVSFSTLTIVFYKSTPQTVAFGSKFKNAFINGWENLGWFFVGLVNVWPFILLAVIGIYAFIKYRKQHSKAKKTKETKEK